MQKIKEFIANNIDCAATDFAITPLNGDASARIYYRIKSKAKSYILADISREVTTFHKVLKTYDVFISLGLRLPNIIATDDQNHYILQQDLGAKSLNDTITPNNAELYYKKLLDVIINMHDQTKATKMEGIDLYDKSLLDKELSQFVNHYLNHALQAAEAQAAAAQLNDIFDDLYKQLQDDQTVLVHRDFHLDNIFIDTENNPVLIDFQDAVLGHEAYDLVSLLQDARRYVTPELEQKMLGHFIKSNKNIKDKERFLQCYYILSLQKNFKIIGIFNRLATEGKIGYIEKCDIVWRYIKRSIHHVPALNNWYDQYNLQKNDR